MQLHFKFWSGTSSKERPKVLLLHGLGGTGEIWRPIAAALEDEMDLLAPDQRGHGKSQRSQQTETPGERSVEASRVLREDYRPEAFGKDIVETLLAQKFFPVWGVGHSMGVRSLLAAGVLNPDYFSGFVLIDLGLSGLAGGGLGAGLGAFIQKLPLSFENSVVAREFMREHCPDPAIGQYLMAVSKRDASGRVEFPFDHEALVAVIDAASQVSVRPWLKELAQQAKPLYLLRGANSKVWSEEEFNREKANFAEFSNVHFETFENAGHGLPFEQRAQFVSWLRQIMSSH